MQLKNKYFPYPVISEDNDSYINSLFNTDVEVIRNGYDVKLILRAKLINEELEEMLKNNDVLIVHHIECPQTCYRKIVCTENQIYEQLIRESEVNGIVQICSFLVANKNINKYKNKYFSDDYNGFSFDIDRGCILAVGKQVNIRIEKIRDDLANTTSIFSILPNFDSNAIDIKVELTDTKIAICLPEKAFYIYKNLGMYMDIQPLMHSMIIIPALMYTLNEIKQNREELYQYEDYRWFRSLKNTCKKIGIDFESKDLSQWDTFSLSQKLLDSPIIKAFDYLGIGGEFDED